MRTGNATGHSLAALFILGAVSALTEPACLTGVDGASSDGGQSLIANDWTDIAARGCTASCRAEANDTCDVTAHAHCLSTSDANCAAHAQTKCNAVSIAQCDTEARSVVKAQCGVDIAPVVQVVDGVTTDAFVIHPTADSESDGDSSGAGGGSPGSDPPSRGGSETQHVQISSSIPSTSQWRQANAFAHAAANSVSAEGQCVLDAYANAFAKCTAHATAKCQSDAFAQCQAVATATCEADVRAVCTATAHAECEARCSSVATQHLDVGQIDSDDRASAARIGLHAEGL